MHERLQKPFLTVETGEAYQPIRLTYTVHDIEKLTAQLNQIGCLQKTTTPSSWHWHWRDECHDLHFESINTYKRSETNSLRLGTISIRQNTLYIHLPSFKRACLAVPLFHRLIPPAVALIHHADFINKVFSMDERLPHNITEIFDDNELENIIEKRMSEYDRIQAQCETATSPEEALAIISEYSKKEAQKRLPYAERYQFEHATQSQDPDVVFLGFYIFLRSRELVAIRRWFGNAEYSLADAADETVEQVFGGMDVDIIE